MIKLIVKRNKVSHEIRSMNLSGHANYDEYGKDIVCAGVSAITLGNLMFIQRNNLTSSIRIIAENDCIDVIVGAQALESAIVLLEAIVSGIKLIDSNHPGYIEIKEYFGMEEKQ